MIKQNKRADLGFFNAAMLILLLLMPVFFALGHLRQNASDLQVKAELRQREILEFEMTDFAESLVPRSFIERTMEKVEAKVGLRTQLICPEGKDPGLFKKTVFKKMLGILKNDFALKPICLVGLEYDLQKTHSFFSKDFDHLMQEEKSRLEQALVGTIINEVMRRQLWKNQEVKDRLRTFGLNSPSFDLTRMSLIEDTLRNFLSPLAYSPKAPGTCHEFFSKSFGSEKIFIYYNGHMQGKHIYWGYFSIFAGRDLSYEKMISLSKKSSAPSSRAILKSSVFRQNNREPFHSEKNMLLRPLPESFQIHVSQKSRKIGFSDLNSIWLSVSVKDKQVSHRLKWLSTFSSMLQKVLILLLFALLSYFFFNGFNVNGRLRKKILLLSGLIILLPYLLVAYFSGLILDSIEKIRPREVQNAADCKMFEVSRFVQDLSLRRQLVYLTAKKRINSLLLKNPKDLFVPARTKKLVPAKINFDELTVVLPDGHFRALNKKNLLNQMPKKLIRFMCYKYLSNLCILDESKEKNRYQLDMANLASGFLSGLQKNYLEGINLSHEAVAIKDISKMEVFSRMSYFIFSTASPGFQTAIGIGLVSFGDLERFGEGNNLVGCSYQRLLKERDGFVEHSFAIGNRNSDNDLESWWPAKLTAKDEEKRLLQYVAKKNFSGSESRQRGDKIRSLVWKHVPQDSHIFSGVTEATPDLWIIFMFNLLPFVGGTFSFLSLFLLADFLWELFVRPVNAFIPALNKIEEGDYQTRIEIEKTDELSILADSFNSMTEGLQQREKMRRFVSERLLENVAQDSTLESTKAIELELSVLMSDIRGFTSLSEKHSPEEIVGLLNDYFTEMEEAIKAHNGSIERYIGDAIVATFYTDSSGKNHGQRAVDAAFAMRSRLLALNEKRRVEGKFLIENGIGIVSDKAICGVTGASSGRQVYMILGSVIPRASELEALTAGFDGERIAVCGKTAEFATNCSFTAVPGESSIFTPTKTR